MLVRQLTIAASLALAGFAAQAATTAPMGNGSDYPAYPATHSTLTRAQVQAEVVAAQHNGTMAMVGDRVNTARNQAAPASALTRAQVQAEAHAAMVTGQLPEGENAFGE